MKKSFRNIGRLIVLSFLLFVSNLSEIKAQCNAIAGVLSATDTNLCTDQITTLTLTGYNGTISWQRRPVGEASWNPVTGSGPTLNLSFPAPGNWEYRAYVTGDICDVQSNLIALHISNFGDTPDPGFGGETCGNTFSLDALNISGNWSLISGPGEVTFSPSANIRNPSVTVNETGIYEFAWSITNGVCTKDSAITMNILQQPVANAGSNFNQCGRSFNLDATYSFTGATGQWIRISGGTFNILEPTNPKSAVTSNTGTFQLRWTETNSVCQDDTTITINVADQPDANAGNSGSECDLNYSLNATSSIYSGYWSLLSGSGSVTFSPNSNTNNAITTANSYGENYILQWKLINSFCSDSDTVVINFYEQPISQLDENNENICGNNTVLAALPSSGVGNWNNISGPVAPALNPINDSTVSVILTGNSYGSYQFRWKEINGICSDSIDIPVLFIEQPIADAGTDTLGCSLSIAIKAVPSVGTGRWVTLQGSEELVFSNPLLAESNVNAPNYGIYNIAWVETNNVYCIDTQAVALYFIEQPLANAGTDTSGCSLSFALEAFPSVGTGRWVTLQGAEDLVFSEPTSAESNVEAQNYGIFDVAWIETNNEFCIDTQAIALHFNEQPIANAGTDTSGCLLSLTIRAIPSVGIGRWEALEGAENLVFSAPTSAESNVAAPNYGIYNIAWIETNNVFCIDTQAIALYFNEQPISNAGSDDTICGLSKTLDATLSTYTGYWSVLPEENTTINNISSPTALFTVENEGTYTLTWTAVNESCSDTSTISITFHEIPEADAGIDVNVCNSEYNLSATPENGFWTIITGNNLLAFAPNAQSANAILNTNEYGIYKLLWTAVNSNCIDTSSVVIQFLERPTANAGPDQQLSNHFEAEILANEPPESAWGQWTTSSDLVTITSPSSPGSNVTGLSLGENSFIWTVTNYTNDECNSSDTLLITVFDIFIPEIITPNGDSENDLFIISGIEDVNPVEVTIFNRWGIEVFYSANYENNWDGTSKSGSELTNDTYFYVVNVAGSRIFKGFVVIKR